MTSKMPRRITSDMLFNNAFQDFFSIFGDAPAFGMNKNIPPYPHFNLSNVDEDGLYTVEVALAGFDKEDITVKFEPYQQNANSGVKVLSINALHNHSDEDEGSGYLHKGIAKRDAKLSLLTHKNDTVESCSYENGVLYITLRKVKPDDDVEVIDIM
jgi:molecular chaperone IbpA